ncbi:glycosyltransferase family 4 protein [Pseudarthrobacter sp. NPDC058362]|uniref:glycosyltransferase family 4 protein n=1 Tax=Pseudarthrobacter sp. NPDC058362 TaxID=3346458 RepID=UPI0036643503
MNAPPIRLLVPGNIRHHSGGNVYNSRLAEGLRGLGSEVEIVPVEGSWPAASALERRRFGSLLGARSPEYGPGEAVVIVDGLVAVGAPDELESGAKTGRPPWILVHMPVPDAGPVGPETPGSPSLDSEARALKAAAGLICTSTTAARTLQERHGIHSIRVALPGTEPAPLAPGSDPPHLVMVAALLPNKDQLLMVQALAKLQDLDWTAALVGSDQADAGYAGQVRDAVERLGLTDRIRLTGELTGAPLAEEWSRASLSLLVSREEAFGMSVTESLARGIPVVVRAGTGAVEALGHRIPRPGDSEHPVLAGAAVPLTPGGPESPGELAAVVRRWLEDPKLRAEWRGAAFDARTRLPDWQHTARTVLEAVRG